MRTIKTEPPSFDTYSTELSKLTKFFNQLSWKGIRQTKNIYDVEQLSCADAENVYVDYEDILRSRKPLQADKLFPTWAQPEGHSLIEILPVDDINVYVTKYTEDDQDFYRIAISEDVVLAGITDYRLATIGHYIVAFNDLGAQVFDMNDREKGWQPMEDFVEIPITKRVVGSQVQTLSANQFTKQYKEQYVWSEASQPQLPTGDAEVVVQTNQGEITWTIPNTDVLTDYRILRPINYTVQPDELITTSHDILCIGRTDHFLISFDRGETFSRWWYPQIDTFLNIASISQDGEYFFVVAKDAVYRCNLGNQSWTKIEHETIAGVKEIGLSQDDQNSSSQEVGWLNTCCFATGDTFAFVTYFNEYSASMYWMGPGLYNSSNLYNNRLGVTTLNSRKNTSITQHMKVPTQITNTDRDSSSLRISVKFDTNTLNTGETTAFIVALLPNDQSQNVFRLSGVSSGVPTAPVAYYDTVDVRYMLLEDTEEVTKYNDVTARGTRFNYLVYTTHEDKTGWWKYYIEVGDYDIEETINGQVLKGVQGYKDQGFGSECYELSDAGAPFKLAGGYIHDFNVYNSDFTVEARLPEEITERTQTWSYYDYFYIQVGDKIYTNRLTTTDIATLTYTFSSNEDPEDDGSFKEVPTVIYSDTELYLAFGNLLKITENAYDGDDIKFNLPTINNQSFISPISNLLNISTTEVAIFFTDKIMICAKVEDEVFGFRYDYYNTKLKLGTRYGDSVINTLEGTYTVFPTRRGLAFMNYQQFYATTDQSVEYVTDNIEDIWTAFFDASTTIKIVQHRSHLLFSNGTGQILLFDMRTNGGWWKWSVPVKVTALMTNQIDIRVLADTLYIFADSNRYWDFPKTTKQKRINWYVQSQVLHMSATNNYKNLKQLVFQVVQTSNELETFMAQIKLYRKRVTVKEPEIVRFKITELRTFVKRFNYWKINEVQWGLANDPETTTPVQLALIGMSVKYELGDEVR